MRLEILKDRLILDSSIEVGSKSTKPSLKGILYEKLDDGFGNSILKKVGENTIVIGGAIESLEHLTKAHATWKPKTLNEKYNLNAGVTGDFLGNSIALFGVGIGGSGLDFGSIVEKNIKLDDLPKAKGADKGLIPLRVTETLTGEDSDKYFFKMDAGNGKSKYYLKEFKTTPVIKSCWKDSADDEVDGTEIIEDIADSKRTDGIQTFAEFQLSLNTKDVREYYEAAGSLDSALYNSIGLFIGQKVRLDDGTEDYVNVRLFSYLNIDNKSVKIKTASEYVYRVLALV